MALRFPRFSLKDKVDLRGGHCNKKNESKGSDTEQEEGNDHYKHCLSFTKRII